MKITFEEVSIKAVRRWKDSQGRPHQETRKFWQTINPFNKGADGLPKSRGQILIEITQERDLWVSSKRV